VTMTNENLDETGKPSRPSRKVGLQIFLSYASERQDAAEEVALALKERGHKVFFDRDRLPPGEGFHARIEQEVQSCDIAVFLISPESRRHRSAGYRAIFALSHCSAARETLLLRSRRRWTGFVHQPRSEFCLITAPSSIPRRTPQPL
jgi:hypothetical protein